MPYIIASPMPDSDERLRDFLLYPTEDLGFEIKRWLDLNDLEHRANLAKALIALANHGGGHLLIGFEEADGGWRPCEPHPGSLAAYSQDSINSVVARFAEPPFHCSVRHVKHPSSDALYPIIRISRGTGVPVRTKSGCGCGCVKANVYYIRRPGPSSDSPRSGREWDELIGRCVRTNRDSLLGDIHSIVMGTATPITPLGISESLDKWISESRDRWVELIRERLPSEDPSRYRYGVWCVAYQISGLVQAPTLRQLRDRLRRAEVRFTGWPEWMVFDNTFVPQPFEATLECLVVGGRLDDVGHSDYWRVAPSGAAFLLRGYQEDATPPHPPGTLLSVTMPIWRLGEAIIHASALSRELDAREPSVCMRVTWEGLKNRVLASFDPGRDSRRSYICHQNSVTTHLEFEPRHVETNLEELVTESLAPLYEAFDLFPLSQVMVAEELTKLKTRHSP
jgi:hypothetical protein